MILNLKLALNFSRVPSLIISNDLRCKSGKPVEKAVITRIRLMDKVNVCYYLFDIIVNPVQGLS